MVYLSPFWGVLTWWLLSITVVGLGGFLIKTLADNEKLKARIDELKAENAELKQRPVEKVLTRGSVLVEQASEVANTALGIATAAHSAAGTMFRLWREINSGKEA